MNSILSAIRNNPVRVYSTITALIAVAAAFGFHLSADQQNSLLGFAAVILGGGEVVRSQVTPTSKA